MANSSQNPSACALAATHSHCGAGFPAGESPVAVDAARGSSGGQPAVYDPLVGEIVAQRYRVEAQLGVGAMGTVYRAQDLTLGRPVALKVLHDELASDPTLSERFDREVMVGARLNHPNCVQALDAGSTADGRKFLTMNLLEGCELRDLMSQPMGVAHTVELVLQILEGLDFAHRRGFVHRDIKPENVFIVRDDHQREVAKVVDFGLVRVLESSGVDPLTRAGFVFGTPWYMAPEQAAGERDIDARADLYALGAMMYEMLVGSPPFDAERASVVLRMHMVNDPPPLPPAVPDSIARFVVRMLAKEPAYRFASARHASEALRDAADTCQVGVPGAAASTSDRFMMRGSDFSPAVYEDAPHSALAQSRTQGRVFAVVFLLVATIAAGLFFGLRLERASALAQDDVTTEEPVAQASENDDATSEAPGVDVIVADATPAAGASAMLSANTPLPTSTPARVQGPAPVPTKPAPVAAKPAPTAAKPAPTAKPPAVKRKPPKRPRPKPPSTRRPRPKPPTTTPPRRTSGRKTLRASKPPRKSSSKLPG